ncbi:Golgi transport complex subunit 5-domain-containing protein [Amylostereum chailletii]|nr:Golgi transport complex subunit 5-domain-containing protein [Amylostereum chailletii]
MSSDYSVFAAAEFDANEYANAALAGEPYPSQAGSLKPPRSFGIEPAKEDISVAISKLDVGIDDVSKQIKNVVTVHHEGLLVQAASVGDLEGSFGSVRAGLDELDTSLDKLRQKIRVPYQAMQSNVTRLQRLQQVSDVLRRTSRFVILAKRLQAQIADLGEESDVPEGKPEVKVNGASLDRQRSSTPGLDHEGEKERTLAQAALSVAELNDLLETTFEGMSTSETMSSEGPPSDGRISLHSVNAVASHIPFIESVRNKITIDMESMVLVGLTETNQSLLASSLQTAHNLRVLPDLVQNLVADLSTAVETRIKSAFDMSRISKELLAKDPTPGPSGVSYKSRVRTEPTNLTAPQWTNALWTRLSSLIEDMAGACIKVYTLEKVLKLKKDPVSQVVFLDEAMKVLEGKPSTTFWTALGRSLEKQSRDSAKNSTFLQQTLSSGYPRLLRLFHDFFAKIAVHTDTVYTLTQQSTETVLVLRALSTFETLYLSRVANRLNETVGQAFQGGARSPPGLAEGINISRTIANELDSAKFDPLLVRSVARSAKSSLDMMMTRLDGLIPRDRSALSLAGPTATPQQALNASIATCLHNCWSRLRKLEDEYPEVVFNEMHNVFDRMVDPLLGVIKRELGSIVARLHKDPGAPVDPMMGSTSPYLKDLVDKLNFIKKEVLSRFSLEDVTREWTISIVQYVMKIFVLHISIVKPLDESRKLQLTNDMTEFEFALSAFLIQNSQTKRGENLDVAGNDYRTLRAMRPLLFLDNSSLASPQHTTGLPPLIVLHHIFVRSPISLPHALHGWQETEYVRWLEEHSEEEALTLIDGGLSRWEGVTESEGTDPSAAVEYVQLARTVLSNARSI